MASERWYSPNPASTPKPPEFMGLARFLGGPGGENSRGGAKGRGRPPPPSKKAPHAGDRARRTDDHQDHAERPRPHGKHAADLRIEPPHAQRDPAPQQHEARPVDGGSHRDQQRFHGVPGPRGRIGPVTSTFTGYPSSCVGMRRRAAAPESARNTRMQGAPSHRPMAVPTTPGNAMSESVWAASTASIVLDVTACVSSRWSRQAPPPSAP